MLPTTLTGSFQTKIKKLLKNPILQKEICELSGYKVRSLQDYVRPGKRGVRIESERFVKHLVPSVEKLTANIS